MRKIIFALIFFLLVLSFHSVVFAQTATPTPKLRQELRNDVKDFRQNVKDDIKNSKLAKPSGFNQKLCEAHVQVAKLRESSMSKRAGNMSKRLDKIASMVESYYTTKLVPQGKTVSSYEALVSDVNAKKAALDPFVAKVQSDSSSLTCTNDSAKSQFQSFRTDATSLLSAFKAYRESVINLVQAVRGASASSNLTPTLTPEVTQ
jgi:uncharacterized protein YoxC